MNEGTFTKVNLGLKEGIQLMQILGLLVMYFDAVVVKVKTFLLLFRLALAILCGRLAHSDLSLATLP